MNVIDFINEKIKDNGIARRVIKLDYPFLFHLPRSNCKKWSRELQEINQLAHNAFEQGESLLGIGDLKNWCKSSPKSWFVYKENHQIYGYIHVEPLSEIRGKAILSGISHEGEITKSDIPKVKKLCDQDFIHIGSIVSNPDLCKNNRPKVALALLAGIVDRVLNVQAKSKGVHLVLAVDYPDVSGRHHARNLLRRYGFNHESGWVTSEVPQNDVYVLDLDLPMTKPARKLIEGVKACQAKNLIKKLKFRKKTLRYSGLIFLVIALIFLIESKLLPSSIIAGIGTLEMLISLLINFDNEIRKLLV
jgi:hypothetical protein